MQEKSKIRRLSSQTPALGEKFMQGKLDSVSAASSSATVSPKSGAFALCHYFGGLQ